MCARIARLALATSALACAACGGTQRMYHWGGYDDALYRHYKSPQEREAFVESLRRVILESEERGVRVPPGICAEFGFALYEEGRLPEAIAYFQREQREWPEARVLMEKMIRNAELRAGKAAGPPALAPAAAQGAAGALEKAP
jgi:hypothetical protein